MRPAVLILTDDDRDHEAFASLAAARLGPVQRVTGVTHARAAVDLYQPLVALLHGPDRLEAVLEQVRLLRRDRPGAEPLLLVTVPPAPGDAAQRALAAGATEILRLPLDPCELQLRCRTLVRLGRQARLILRVVHRRLPRRDGTELGRELQRRLEAADAARDRHTHDHGIRTGRLSALVAESLGLGAEECERIAQGARVHDIGKLGIPEAIIRKPGRFTPEERQVMQDHPVIGYEILRDGPSPALQCGASIALSHHEKFDGSGYPQGIGGSDIPLAARIVAVADVFDSLASRRPYRDPITVTQALGFVARESGRHFDPACVRALADRRRAVEALYPTQAPA